jgi:hypothetical protein
VLLVGNYAIKVPNFLSGWRLFLQGLLANMQERVFSAAGWPELCPVVASLPGGWLVVMRRVRVMTDAEFQQIDSSWLDRGDYVIPAELKPNSFGWLGEKLVAIDYGN